MLHSMTPTDVAFTMVALMQGVLALIWGGGAWVAAPTRAATLQWAGYAGLSALSFMLLSVALHSADAAQAQGIRAAGNVAGVLAMMALQRGIWLFVGRRAPWRSHALPLALVLIAAGIGLDPAYGFVRVGVNTAVLTWLSLTMARDLYGHGRDTLRLRWPLLLALPLLLAALGHAQRGLRALADPASVATQMAADSALNVGSAYAYVVLSLAFHAVLATLVVGRLLAELQHRSRHDGLTGVLNRRATEEALAEQLARSRRSAEPFVVMMLDMDHFKAINDRLGHAVGDLALKHAAALLAGVLREGDRLGRFGGEEFLVLLPGATLAQAEPLAERLRAALAQAPLVHAGASVKLSISIGLAEWHGAAGEEVSRLLVRADVALYQAKQRGRDRVELSEPDAPLALATP